MSVHSIAVWLGQRNRSTGVINAVRFRIPPVDGLIDEIVHRLIFHVGKHAGLTAEADGHDHHAVEIVLFASI